VHIETLKVFLDLVESRSFSQAAVRNFITQSAVSQQVKALESRFETALFQRDGRAMVPTEAGRALYEGARDIVERFERLQIEVRGVGQEVAGTVRVATVYSVGLYEMSVVVKTFLKTYPKVNLHVEYRRANMVYEDCLRGVVDLGVVPYPKPHKGLEIVPLAADRLILICATDHAFAQRRTLEISRLNGQNFIAFERDIPSRQAIDHILHENQVRVHTVMEFDNIETIKRSVEIGAGVSIVPLASVQREVQARSLAQVQFAGQGFLRPLGAIIRRRHVLSPPAVRFLELLQERAENR
jgi:LysR family transcriptional regulator, transcriptional activator of the cysJI operon